MKICIIANPNSPHTRRWVSYFASSGHEVHLIGEHKPVLQQVNGVTQYILTETTNLKKFRYLIWSVATRKIVNQIKPDILHALGVVSAGWLAFLSGFHPYLLTAMGSDINLLGEKHLIFRTLTKSTLRNADYVLCVSNELADRLRKLDIPPEQREVVYLGIDTSIFQPGDTELEAEQKLSDAYRPLVLSIRSVNAIYNPLDIAAAIPIVLSKVPETQFIILTYQHDARLLSQFKRILKLNNVNHAVKYVSGIDDDQRMAEYYRAADLGVSVPSSDGTPISVLECMACGTPLVLSDLASLHEWVVNEQEGLFIPVGDVDEIASAIVHLLKDENLRDRLGSNASQKILQRADSSKWMKKSEEIYRRFALGDS